MDCLSDSKDIQIKPGNKLTLSSVFVPFIVPGRILQGIQQT
jgi:hypothetical protein